MRRKKVDGREPGGSERTVSAGEKEKDKGKTKPEAMFNANSSIRQTLGTFFSLRCGRFTFAPSRTACYMVKVYHSAGLSRDRPFLTPRYGKIAGEDSMSDEGRPKSDAWGGGRSNKEKSGSVGALVEKNESGRAKLRGI